MNVEHLQLSRRVVLEATGGADAITVTLESGTPYRHLNMWVKAAGIGTIDVTAQPLYGGVADGSPTAVGNSNPTKVFQIPVEEVRPATRITRKHPDDMGKAASLKPELLLTNNAAAPVQVSIYLMAMATPGGA
jgi:hypothetical protein